MLTLGNTAINAVISEIDSISTIKQEQVHVLPEFLRGKDVFTALPTGFINFLGGWWNDVPWQKSVPCQCSNTPLLQSLNRPTNAHWSDISLVWQSLIWLCLSPILAQNGAKTQNRPKWMKWNEEAVGERDKWMYFWSDGLLSDNWVVWIMGGPNNGQSSTNLIFVVVSPLVAVMVH